MLNGMMYYFRQCSTAWHVSQLHKFLLRLTITFGGNLQNIRCCRDQFIFIEVYDGNIRSILTASQYYFDYHHAARAAFV